MGSYDELLAELTALERELHDPVTRRDPGLAGALLAQDFREFGASGQVYDKIATLRLLGAEAGGEAITSGEYHLTPLAPDAALFTYRSARGGVTTLRSSLWVRCDGRWQLLFHQGTRAAE